MPAFGGTAAGQRKRALQKELHPEAQWDIWRDGQLWEFYVIDQKGDNPAGSLACKYFVAGEYAGWIRERTETVGGMAYCILNFLQELDK